MLPGRPSVVVVSPRASCLYCSSIRRGSAPHALGTRRHFLLQSFLVARGLCRSVPRMAHLQGATGEFRGGVGRGFLILRTGRPCIGGVVHSSSFFLICCDVRLGLDDIGMIDGVACSRSISTSAAAKAAAAESAGCWPIRILPCRQLLGQQRFRVALSVVRGLRDCVLASSCEFSPIQDL